MPRLPRDVWRLALLWQGTVLDVVTVKRRRGTLDLRTGERLRARAVGGQIEITGAGPAPIYADADILVELPAGHALIASRAAPEADAGRLSSFDGTLFHAAMVGAAVQACVVSALVLAPRPQLDPEAGGGVRGDLRRLLVTGGTAPHSGPAVVAATGHAPEEAERIDLVRRKGEESRPARGSKGGPTVEQLLDEMRRALNIGSDGVELKDALGEMAQAMVRAPELGAGLGGLVPVEPAAVGAGNGAVGVGESRLAEILKERVEKAKRDDRLAPRTERAPIPVQLIDVPDAHVTTVALEGQLDPAVRKHLSTEVRERHGSVRYCYESWGLAGNPTRAGRLVLELTLLPNGRVADPKVSAENGGLTMVAECVQRMAADWYLGDGLVDEPKRLSFPFVLQPAKDVTVYDYDGNEDR
ncbi:MAG: hypothetical protein IT383_18590 [Deltaproteobacteria bacterium]|nr:hypothetical protein [Deltaproteobacteria bacterium]